ncbi:MAG TPA: sulfur oxidation c-type cytochrome SoxA [Burkholderiaceae bacterium]|nr:sulfur oxidation c-type cytochrome SoxA [Burkholderiaceae bacterium]
MAPTNCSRIVLPLAVAGMLFAPAYGQDRTQQEIERYRQMLQDGNPAELLVARGEGLWKEKRGPRNASLEQCDLGLGAGVVKGAYALLPRYFADADQVMDFETRLVHCMVSLQGFDRAEATKSPFSGAGQRQTDIESITAYVVDASRGATIAVPQTHAKEKVAFERGKYLFYMRAGPYDFACSTCHGFDNQRIRLQDLPNFEKAAPAQRAFATWPAYRVSQGALRTMQWRIWDCFRQQRFPEPVFASQATVDLITFLGVKANGGTMDSPAIKR